MAELFAASRASLHSGRSGPLTVPKEEAPGTLSGLKQPPNFTTRNREKTNFTPIPPLQEGREGEGEKGAANEQGDPAFLSAVALGSGCEK